MPHVVGGKFSEELPRPGANPGMFCFSFILSLRISALEQLFNILLAK